MTLGGVPFKVIGELRGLFQKIFLVLLLIFFFVIVLVNKNQIIVDLNLGIQIRCVKSSRSSKLASQQSLFYKDVRKEYDSKKRKPGIEQFDR